MIVVSTERDDAARGRVAPGCSSERRPRQGGPGMATIDPTFYRTAAEAAAAPPSSWPTWSPSTGPREKHDAMTVVDVDPASDTYGRVVGWTDLPGSATSCTTSAGTPAAARSSTRATTWTASHAATCWCPGCARRNIHVLDTQPDPRQPHAGQDDRREGAGREGRLLPPAHPALRPGRDLPVLPRRRRRRRRRAGRDRAARPRHLRRAARLGDRPRAAVPRLRRLVAPQPERADHQRVGHARR